MKAGKQFKGFQFDERTNIGAGENSQGTLFHVARGRDQSGPKGFSPDRQDEVRKMTGPDTESDDYDPRWSRPTSIDVHSLPGRKVEYNEGGRAGIPFLSRSGEGTRNANVRVVQDMISRSSIPDLHPDQRTKIIVHSADEPISDRSSSVVGMYHAPKYGNPHTIRVADRAISSEEGQGRLGGSPTLIHELGHRDSYINKTDSSKYDTPTRQGVEEAYADDFAANHTRGFGNRSMTWLRSYPTPPHLDYQKGRQFRDAYDRGRTTPAERPGTNAPIQKHEQESLLVKQQISERGKDGIGWKIPAEGQAKYKWAYKGEHGIPTDQPPQ